MGNITKKITSVVFSTTTAAVISGFALLVPIAYAQSASDLQSQINALLQQISALQAKLASSGGSSAASCNFTRDLTVGAKGDDVKCLQSYLKVSPVSGYYGPLTKAAVAKWQSSNGVSPAAGYWGKKSQAKYASIVAAAPAPSPAPSPAPAPTPTPAGALTVALAANQPAAGLFPAKAASVKFTTLTFSASADGDVTVNSLTVQRTGSAANSAFAGVIAVDENGIRIGTAKSLGSDNRAILTEPFVVKAGQSRTITLAGDSASDLSANVGQLASLSLVGATTSGAAVNATFPMTGTLQTVNNSLTIGAVTAALGPSDPGAAATKEAGTIGYVFSSLKLTAGSAEAVSLKSIKWYQSGSASPSDLANMTVYVDGAPYSTTLSSDKRYFVAVFNPPILIDKGLSREVLIKGDVASGSLRTVEFDLFRYSDLQVTGTVYGYDILATALSETGQFQASEPRFKGNLVTISAGTIAIAASNAVPSQNIGLNLANQPLGAFDVTVKGEPISVGGMKFRLSRWDGTGAAMASTQDVTNITLVDQNGNVVAGPVDIQANGPLVTFTDAVTFPVGTRTYTLRGKAGTDYANNDTIAASTTPSSDWSSVRGQVTNTAVTPSPSSTVTGNTMTVKTASLSISVSPTPVAQTVVAGIKPYTFAKYVLDATASGEDTRINVFKPRLTFAQAGSAKDLTQCQLFDGTTPLNTGGNVANPSSSDTSPLDKAFNLDTSLVVPRGTLKTLSLQCNTTGTTTTTSGYTFSWGYDSTGGSITATGVTSGQTATLTITSNAGQTQTLTQGGSLAVSDDPTAPSYAVLAANTTGSLMGKILLRANTEAINVTQMGLQILSTASSSPQNLTKVTLWDGATKVGETVFTSNFATVTFSGLSVAKDTEKSLTVQGDLAPIGVGLAGTQGALIQIAYNGSAADVAGNTTRGVGQSSGVTIYATGGSTNPAGVRVFKTYPTFAKLAVGDTSALSGTNNREIYRWSMAANSNGNVGLFKFTFRIATSSTPTGTSSTTVTNLKVFAYADSALSIPVTGYAAGQLNNAIAGLAGDGLTNNTVTFNVTGGPADQKVEIPAGSTYYFKATADISLTGGPTAASVSTKLMGDSAYPALASCLAGVGCMDTAANINAGANNNFIWSPNATTTSATTHQDWTNSYIMPGLPAGGSDSQGLSK